MQQLVKMFLSPDDIKEEVNCKQASQKSPSVPFIALKVPATLGQQLFRVNCSVVCFLGS